MKQPRRKRLAILLVCGGLLVALCWLAARERSKGASYYFPTWNADRDGVGDRVDELTNVQQSLPIVLEALEQRPSRLGDYWNSFRKTLPSEMVEKLPKYSGPNDLALHWIGKYAAAPEVACAFTNLSPSVWDRGMWISALEPAAITNRPEYLLVFRTICQNTESYYRGEAALLLSSYRPISPSDVVLLTNWLREAVSPSSRWSAPSSRWSIIVPSIRLVSINPPPELRSAFETCLVSTNVWTVTMGAVALGQLDPETYPPAKFLEPALRKVWTLHGRFLLDYNQGDTQAFANDWGIGFLGKLLSVGTNSAYGYAFEDNPPKYAILRCLQSMGDTALPALPEIANTLGESWEEKEAARTFVSIAGHRAEYIPTILHGLTNADTAAPLLLWLTSLGSRASLATDAVRRLATNGLQFPAYLNVSSPSGGFFPRDDGATVASLTSSSSGQRDRPWSPEEVVIAAAHDCPEGLIRFWPGYEAAFAKWSKASKEPLPLENLPQSNLAELAQRCLAAMTNEVAPTSSAAPSP